MMLTLLLSGVIHLHSMQAQFPAYEISGVLQKWHNITLTFEGPESGEGATYNPFLHYRLQVTFRQGERTFIVPGYFAADGDAGNSSATSGNKWRVHFAPDQVGLWNFSVSFRTGANIAVDANTMAGESGHDMDGLTGSFEVAPSDKQGRDLRAHGRLISQRQHYLYFAETGKPFYKAGADAPENLLAYEDFDGSFKSDGRKDHFVKTWEAHLSDWNNGDPTWQNGKGKALIGAINYLAAKGMNAFSFLTLNISGDDENVFPYVHYDNYERMDCSKLDQWEILFSHADQLGMFLHFKMSEDENQGLLDGGALGIQRKLYYRELIARFGHHLALNWNIGEENGRWHKMHKTPWQTTTQRLGMAQYFYDTDPYHHHVVVHNGQQFYDIMGPESKYTGISLQTNRPTFDRVHSQVLKWRTLSADQRKPWAIAVDEPGDAQHSLLPDAEDPEHDLARQNALWGAFMAGAWGIEWYFGYRHAHSDLTCQDWRSRDRMWDQSRHCLAFFQQNDLPIWSMEPMDDLTANDDYVFALPGSTYLIYQKIGSKTETIIPDAVGTYTVRWYDPKTGQYAHEMNANADGQLVLGMPPRNADQDWAIIVSRDFDSLGSPNNWIGWDRFLRDRPMNDDPDQVFAMEEDGVHVTGKEFGYLISQEIFDNFHLKFEYKWGEDKWPPRLKDPRDAGVIYHVPDGTVHKIWPRGIECQIQEGDTGDFWLIDSTVIDHQGYRTHRNRKYVRAIKSVDAEHESGEWNTVEVISNDGKLVHLVNGKLVNVGTKANRRRGKILFQSEGSEIYYRKMQIKRL